MHERNARPDGPWARDMSQRVQIAVPTAQLAGDVLLNAGST